MAGYKIEIDEIQRDMIQKALAHYLINEMKSGKLDVEKMEAIEELGRMIEEVPEVELEHPGIIHSFIS